MDDTPTVVMGSRPDPEHPRHAQPRGEDGGGRSNKLMVFLVVVVILLACSVTGLAVAMLIGDDADETASTTTTTTIAQTPGGGGGSGAITPSPGGGGGETDSGTSGDDGGDEAITDEPAAPCSASAISATIGGSLAGTPVNVTDLACTSSGAYAWALLTPTAANVDPVYAYFRDVGGGWELMDYGTGITCTDVGIPAAECTGLP